MITISMIFEFLDKMTIILWKNKRTSEFTLMSTARKGKHII